MYFQFVFQAVSTFYHRGFVEKARSVEKEKGRVKITLPKRLKIRDIRVDQSGKCDLLLGSKIFDFASNRIAAEQLRSRNGIS